MSKERVKLSEKIDFFFNKLLPKKFIVWVVATVVVFTVKNTDNSTWLSGEVWGYITLAYMGVNIVGKFAKNRSDGGML